MDSRPGETRGSGARAHFNHWLASLVVGDAWRRHHPDDRVFSGPVLRVNRLDYIFWMTCLWTIINRLLRILSILTVVITFYTRYT